jgi:DNA invertase Pin-like site-specific DNA recombinase
MIRLSSMRDTSDSPEKQIEHCRGEAAANGGHIIGWAVDLDVSGATNPFMRKGFGPWLRGEEGPYNGVIASAVDRIGRTLVDVLVTAYHLRDNGKLIITRGHNGPWDLYDSNDELAFSFQAMAAQSELRNIQRRSGESRERQRKTGQKVGRLAYGYRYMRKGESRVVEGIAIDPAILAILKESGDRLLADRTGLITVTSEARRLTLKGVLTDTDYRRVLRGLEPDGIAWNGSTLKAILTSLATQGYYLENGKPVIGPKGEPIRIAPPMWSYSKHLALVEKLAPKPLKKKRAPKADYIGLEISVCGTCGNRLYYQKRPPNARTCKDEYRCKARMNGLPGGEACKPSPVIQADEFEAFITQRFLSLFGDNPLFEQAFDPGSDVTAQLAELKAKRQRLQDDRDAGLYDAPEQTDWFRSNYIRLSGEIKELEAVPKRPARLYWRPTGRTVADEWNYATTNTERRELMASYGFRVELHPITATQRVVGTAQDSGASQDARAATWEAHQRDMQAEAEYYARLAAEQEAAEADADQAAESTEYLIPSEAEQTAGLCAAEDDGERVLELVA